VQLQQTSAAEPSLIRSQKRDLTTTASLCEGWADCWLVSVLYLTSLIGNSQLHRCNSHLASVSQLIDSIGAYTLRHYTRSTSSEPNAKPCSSRYGQANYMSNLANDNLVHSSISLLSTAAQHISEDFYVLQLSFWHPYSNIPYSRAASR